MQKYLGLDIGTYSIKALVIKISFEHYYVEEAIEQEIHVNPDSDLKSAQKEALKIIKSRLIENEFDSLYANFGCQHTVMKKFDLNNVKRSDRQKIIESEFDLLGIFNLDDYTIEYHTIKFEKEYAKILAILINKECAKNLIDILDSNEFGIRIIDVDNLVFLNLINFLPEIEDNDSRGMELFLDFGHSKTSITYIENNKVINTKIINIGGKYLTHLIQTKLNTDFQSAQNIKHNLNNQIDDKKYFDIKIQIEKFFEEICNEIKRTIQLINASEQIKVDRIFYTGGTINLEESHRLLEKHLETELINLSTTHKKIHFSENESVNFNSFTQSFCVIFRANLEALNSKINIRHGQLALISNYEKIITELSKYSKLVAIFILVLLSTYFFRSILFSTRINELKFQYKKEITKIFTNEPKELRQISGVKNWSFDEYSASAIKILRDGEKNKIDIINNLSLNNVSIPLKILNLISISIPKTIYFEVLNFKYQDDFILIEGDSTSSDFIQEIVNRLKVIKILTQVVKKSEEPKVGSEGKLVHFVITANVVPKGDQS